MESEGQNVGGVPNEGTTEGTNAGSTGSTETSTGETATNRERAPNASETAGSPTNSGESQSEGEGAGGDLLNDEGGDGEGEGEGNKPGEGEKPSDDAGTLGAPEDGYKFEHVENGVPVDEETLKEFGDVAKELNLSQEAAQKIVSKLEPMLQRSLERNRATWEQATRADAELGGANLKANLGVANRAFKETTTPELRALLKASGLVNHPEVVRHFFRLGKTISDGSFVTGSGMSERSAQTVFYKGMSNP